MSIKNLKIGKGLKKTASYVLVATLTFTGMKTFMNHIIRDDMPVYSVEKLTRVETMEDYNPGTTITIKKEEDTYSPKLFSDSEPTNKIIEYNEWEEKDDHFERNVDIYKTDMNKKAIKEILKSKLSTNEFINKTSTITETSSKEPNEMENTYKEAYIYEYQKDRELTEEEQEKANSVANKTALLGASLMTLLWLYDSPRTKKQASKEKVKK